jgi:hypothetical protein
MTPTSDPIRDNLPGLLFLIVIIAVPLAFLVSIGLLRLYRRTVIRAMGKRVNVSSTEPVPLDSSGLPEEPIQTPLKIAVFDPVSVMPTRSAPEGLYADLLRAPWRAAAIYAAAGFCYAIVMAIAYLAATNSRLSFFIWLWIYAWPIVLVINIVAVATWRTKLMIVSAYFLILAVLYAIAVVKNPALTWIQIARPWFITNFLVTVLLLAFLNRSVQAVGPLVLIVMLLAVTGSNLALIIVDNNARLRSFIAEFATALGLGHYIFTGLVVIGFIIFGVVGWLVLQWIVVWYKRKKISDQSITIDAIWLLYGIIQSIDLIFEGTIWFLAVFLAFVIYKVVSWVGFSVLSEQASSSRKSPILLLLRVFSLGKRSERLFDALALHWRYIGGIRLIAGPDLATSTVEPHEFLDFLSGKLARRFIDNSQTLELRISEMDVRPDRDGRFRVNDFFCYEDTWRVVLSRLVGESDIVLMDLRGFSSQNTGCVFEINELINLVPLGRVLFIIDETTDEPFLRQVMQQSWDHMGPTSPNRLSPSGLLHLFRLREFHNRELQRLLHVLSTSANAAPEVQGLA